MTDLTLEKAIIHKNNMYCIPTDSLY